MGKAVKSMVTEEDRILYRVIATPRSEELNGLLDSLPNEFPDRPFRVVEYTACFNTRSHEMVYSALVAWLPKFPMVEKVSPSKDEASSPKNEAEIATVKKGKGRASS